MSKEQKKANGLNMLADLLARVKTLEEAQSVHENRLNHLNIPVESVQAISVQTLNMLGHMLITVTEPQQQSVSQPDTEVQEVPIEGVS